MYLLVISFIGLQIVYGSIVIFYYYFFKNDIEDIEGVDLENIVCCIWYWFLFYCYCVCFYEIIIGRIDNIYFIYIGYCNVFQNWRIR